MGPRARDPASLVPLTPAVFHIMLALGEGPAHGYRVMQRVARITEGEVTLGPGTLYRSIQKMLIDGLIVERRRGTGGDGGDDERRRTYALTGFGRRVAEAETERLATLVRAARARGFTKRTRRAHEAG